MTEKEAIERLKYDLAMITFNPMTGEDTPLWLLSEDAQGSYNAYEMAIKALEAVQQYREIGTVEECRELAEKQKPEKPDYEGDGYDNNGNIIYDTWICPTCGARYEVDYDDYKHCPECGQAIDLSGEV